MYLINSSKSFNSSGVKSTCHEWTQQSDKMWVERTTLELKYFLRVWRYVQVIKIHDKLGEHRIFSKILPLFLKHKVFEIEDEKHSDVVEFNNKINEKIRL